MVVGCGLILDAGLTGSGEVNLAEPCAMIFVRSLA
jgi:hypothetical protein